MVYFAVPGSAALASLVWVDRQGREEPVAANPAGYQEFNLSPDGTRVALRVGGSALRIGGDDTDVWIYNLTRDINTRLTFESDAVGSFLPTWTPDGTRVAFGSPISWKRADGTGDVERLDENLNRYPLAFSPDGTGLVFQDWGSATAGGGLGMLTLEGDRTSTVLLDDEFTERDATLSPDGRWLAYESDETGQRQVYVRPFPDVDTGKWQISTDGGVWPLWNPADNELFYRGATGLMALSFEADPTFTPGALTQVFEWNFLGRAFYRGIAVSPDGQQFLLLANVMVDGVTEAAPREIIVVQNWFEELRRLAPVAE